MSAAAFEGAGYAAARDCLNAILNGADQAEAIRSLVKLLDGLSGDGKIAKGARRGAAVALVNVLERGLGAISSDAECEARPDASNPGKLNADAIAEIRAADDGIEAADMLAGAMLAALGNGCHECQAAAAHELAVSLLPLVRPDLFAGHAEKGGRQ